MAVSATTLLADLQHRGLRIRAAGEALIVEPRSALTDELRAAIRANKPAILRELADGGFEARRRRVLAMLADSPSSIRYAWLADPNTQADYVSVALAIRDVGSCELRILKERYDPVRMMEIIEASAKTPDDVRQ